MIIKKKYFILKNYFNWIYINFYKFFLPIIRKYEKKKFKKYNRGSIQNQPIFIIGAPRSGSTVLYQMITNTYDVTYINNLTCALNKNILFGLWLSKIFFKNRPHNCFRSDFGDSKGLHSPSECGNFWYRWLPTHKHFIDHYEIKKSWIKNIDKEVTKVLNYFNKPFLFKNLSIGQRLRLIIKIFPKTQFIFVRRNPLFTAQSIILAKRKLKIPDNHFWSIMPRNVKSLKKLPWPEQIVKQIFFLEKQIANDLKFFPRENIFQVNFDELTKKKIVNLTNQMGLKKKNNSKFPKVFSNKKIFIKKYEVNLLKDQIKKLDWSLTYVK